MPTSTELAAAFRAAIDRQDAAALGRLAKAYSQLYARMQGKLDSLLLAISKLDAPTNGQVMRLAQYRNLMSALEDELAKYSAYVQVEIQTNAQASIEMAVKQTESFLKAAGYAMPKSLPTNAIYSMLGFLQEDSPLWERLGKLAGTNAQKVADALLEGIAFGYNPVKTAKLFENVMGGGLTDALRMARTSQLYAAREASRASYIANADVVEGWEWWTALDSDVCMACAVEHGTVHSLDESMDSHYNCFPAGVLVTGPTPIAGTKRHYTGELVTIRTASGVELSFTPNHPILTRSGWVAGGLLQKGDYVIRSTGSKNADSAVDINYNDIPTMIEKIVESFDMVLVEVPTSPEDFHGDGIGSEIHTVLTNSLLWSKNNTSFNKPGIEQDFSMGASIDNPLTSERSLDERFVGTRATSNSFMGGSGVSSSFFGAFLARLQEISLRIAANFNALFQQTRTDNVSGNAVRLGESILRFAGNIARSDISERGGIVSSYSGNPLLNFDSLSFGIGPQFDATSSKSIFDELDGSVKIPTEIVEAFPVEIELDEIIEVNRSIFSGQVYNLQTTHEWYVANSIITHNCRCTSIPVVKGWSDPSQTGVDWFKGLPESQQREMMGNSAFEAWQAGKFDLSDMATRRHDDVYGEMLTQTPLQDLLSDQSEE